MLPEGRYPSLLAPARYMDLQVPDAELDSVLAGSRRPQLTGFEVVFGLFENPRVLNGPPPDGAASKTAAT